MKLGFQILQDGMSFSKIKDIALASEEAGYDSIWILDHFHAYPDPLEAQMLECLTVLSALSTITSKLRLGTTARANPFYRNWTSKLNL